MKIIRSLFLCLLSIVMLLSLNSCLLVWSVSLNRESTHIDLGVPIREKINMYSKDRYINDMIVVDGILYIGYGARNSTASTTDFWAYKIDEDEWYNSGKLAISSVSTFCVVGDKVYIPGSYNNPSGYIEHCYYFLDKDKTWEKITKLEKAYISFDIIEYDNKIFSANGVRPGFSPIYFSKDNGETFINVDIMKNGRKTSTSFFNYVHSYDFFILGDDLYASFVYGSKTKSEYAIYKYNNDNETFDYLLDFEDVYKGYDVGGDKEIRQKVSFNGKIIMATGCLMVTSNMEIYDVFTFAEEERICDVYVYDGVLYVLGCTINEDETYTIKVWSSKTGDMNSYRQVMFFKYYIPAVSLAVSDDYFFFGMFDNINTNMQNGAILKVEK